VPTQRPPTLTSSRLASALSHPTRLRTMKVVSERTATPREIAEEIGEPINNVAYHIKILQKLDCIELVKVEQAHGGRVAEHFYRASERPYFDDDSWEQLGQAEKLDVIGAIMQEITEDVAEAMASGTFYDPDDNHLSRTPMVLDQEGWREVVKFLDDASDHLTEIQARVDQRRGPDDEVLLTKVEIIQFRSPNRGPKQSKGATP
jgi:DNA-binding transcriptional ArsR family regulator